MKELVELVEDVKREAEDLRRVVESVRTERVCNCFDVSGLYRFL